MTTVYANSCSARCLVVKVLAEPGTEKEIQDIVTTCLGQTYPVPTEQLQNNLPCCVVGTSATVCTPSKTGNHVMIICVGYRSWGETANDIITNSVEENMVVLSEMPNSTSNLFDPELIADKFRQLSFPKGTRIIGTSGVSEAYGSKMWAEVVREDRQWMSGEGDGFAVHLMSLYDANTDSVYYTQECSREFNWLGYNYANEKCPSF